MSITAIQSGLGANAIQGISGTVTTTSAPYQGILGGGIVGGSITTPYYGYQPQYTWPQTTSGTSIVIEPDISLRKVENGWVLKMHGKEYVLTETAQVTKYLQLFEQSK